MTVWQVLLIWLTALAGTGCIGFLIAGILALSREAEEFRDKNRPPASPSVTPRKMKWWWWLVYGAFMTLSNCAQDLPPRAKRIYEITLFTVCGAMIAFFVIHAFIFGWRVKRDGQFCIKAAAVCALLTATSGFSLWRFH